MAAARRACAAKNKMTPNTGFVRDLSGFIYRRQPKKFAAGFFSFRKGNEISKWDKPPGLSAPYQGPLRLYRAVTVKERYYNRNEILMPIGITRKAFNRPLQF